MNKGHPKLVARGTDVEEAGLKFKGAPADDCDPFAIQNYIDRLAAEVYDSLNPSNPLDKTQEDKDEWELMKEKAKSVPFQDVSLSIALKHSLLDEVKKENANKNFEKDNILTIMKVRDEFLHDYKDAHAFEYQWQIWVEWERYLKQIGITIPQWGKIARKLIRLGVQLIQEDMTKKYAQISAGSNKRKPQEPEEGQERRRRVTLPSDTPAPYASPGFAAAPILRSSSFGGYMEAPFSTTSSYSTPSTPYSSTPSTPYSSAPSTPIYSAPSTPTEAPFSPMQMQSPITTSPTFRTHYEHAQQAPTSYGASQAPSTFGAAQQAPSAFGASLYTMIHSASPSTTNIFANTSATRAMRSPSLGSTAPQTAHGLDTRPMRSPSLGSALPPPSPHALDIARPMSSPALGSAPPPSPLPMDMSFTPPSTFSPPTTTFSPPTYSTPLSPHHYATPPFSTSASLPQPYDSYTLAPTFTPTPAPPPPPTYHAQMTVPHSPSYYSPMQYTTPHSTSSLPYSTTPPTYMVSSPSSAPPSLASSPSFSTLSSPSPIPLNLPPQFQPRADGTTHMF